MQDGSAALHRRFSFYLLNSKQKLASRFSCTALPRYLCDLHTKEGEEHLWLNMVRRSTAKRELSSLHSSYRISVGKVSAFTNEVQIL